MTIQFIVLVLSSLTFYRVCYCATFPTLLVSLLSSFRISSTCSLVCMFNSHVPNDPWAFVNLSDLPRAHQKIWKHGKWRLTTISPSAAYGWKHCSLANIFRSTLACMAFLFNALACPLRAHLRAKHRCFLSYCITGPHLSALLL
jgi:hypothetical protein